MLSKDIWKHTVKDNWRGLIDWLFVLSFDEYTKWWEMHMIIDGRLIDSWVSQGFEGVHLRDPISNTIVADFSTRK